MVDRVRRRYFIEGEEIKKGGQNVVKRDTVLIPLFLARGAKNGNTYGKCHRETRKNNGCKERKKDFQSKYEYVTIK